MRSVLVLKQSSVLLLGAFLLCAPLLQAHAQSQNLNGNNGARSRVALAHFFQAHATASDRGVLVEWRTSFEPDILGFNVYRLRGGQRTQLNPSLIAGLALVTPQQAPLGSYAWFDSGGSLSSEYYVESLDVVGAAARHDAIKPEWSAVLPNRPSSDLLVNLGANARAASTQEQFADTLDAKLSGNSTEDAGPESLSDQWNLVANQPALKIAVRADGWYRITQPELAAAGFATSSDARNLRLFVGGNEVAMSVSRDSGPLTSADYIEFWGQALDLPTTDTQIYWLVNGAQAGKRIAIAGEVSTNGLPTSTAATSPRPLTSLAGQAPLPYWFGSILANRSQEPEFQSPKTEVKNQQSENAQPQSASADDRSTNPTLREGSDAAIRRPTAMNNEPLGLSPVINPTVRDLPLPPASAAESDKPVGMRKMTSVSDSKFQPRSKPRRHRRRHSLARRRNHPTTMMAAAPNFISTVQRKDRTLYFTRALNGDQENFFGEVINASSAPVTLTLRNIETSSAATAQVTVSLQGVSVLPHIVNVLVNNNLAGTINYLYQDAAVQTFSVPVSWLIEGSNTVAILAPGNDVSLLDYVRLSYPHSLKPDNDSLQFTAKSTLAARIDGFTTANIRVLDISDPLNVQEVHPIVEQSSAGFALTIQPVGRTKGRRLTSLPRTQLLKPASLTLNTPSTLNAATNGADLLVISYKDFIPSFTTVQPPSALSFVALRSTQYAVKVVDVEDVFDEFSYGVHTPQAIRDFLSLANTTWATKPRYVLLVGDASLDPRNYQGFGNFDFLPTKLIDTGFKNDATALETASDDWFTDFNGDGIADISIGRLPVRTLAEANLVVGKIVNYSPANQTQSALLVADSQGSYYWNFEASDDDIGNLLPASYAKQKVYRRLEPSDVQTNIDIANQINAGPALVVYSGHGNVNIWSSGSIFATDDASASGGRGALTLTNGNKLPFLVVMDCLNGYFFDPRLESLAEGILKAPSGGAVASFASSGLTIPDGQHQMGQAMFQLLYNGPAIPIGDASRQAKLATSDADVRRTWILFGDPTMKIR